MRDVTLRALDVLAEVDGVIGESYRQASTLMKKLGLPEKTLFLLDEHDEDQQTEQIMQQLLEGNRLALISDCGTPAFEDPGSRLIARCLEHGITVKPIPGASSLMAAISLSPIPLKQFLFLGFLPQKRPERLKKFVYVRKQTVPVILMDTPYRLSKLLAEVKDHLGGDRLVTLAVDLTLPTETVLHGRVREITSRMQDRKGEFILIVY